MGDKEKSSHQGKENSITTKMVVLKLMSDGTAEAVSVEANGDDPITIDLVAGEVKSRKVFKVLPKRLSFFFEKGFKF
jgi:3-isopropylmalate dehydratase small subunit